VLYKVYHLFNRLGCVGKDLHFAWSSKLYRHGVQYFYCRGFEPQARPDVNRS